MTIENIYALANALECAPKDLMPDIKLNSSS